MKKLSFFCAAFLCLLVAFAGFAMENAGPALMSLGLPEDEGAESYVVYPVLVNGGEYTDQVNAAIQENAQIGAYQNVLAFGGGSTGIRVDWEGEMGQEVLSLVISADGKMPVGRPSQVYYPMNYDLRTGEEIVFERLFEDADGAMAYMEEKLLNEEEKLSTHLENRNLFPVPYERFTLDNSGGITIYYLKEELSFLSGFSGSVYFRYSELEPYFDLTEDSIVRRMKEEDTKVGYLQGLGSRNCIGLSLEEALNTYRSTVDSEYYPGGACYEVEDARLYGTLLLTDESEERVLGVLCGSLDDNGIVTGKTTLEEAKALLGDGGISIPMDGDTAMQYRVCKGESVTWQTTVIVNGTEEDAEYTLYADEDNIVQYIRMMIRK